MQITLTTRYEPLFVLEILHDYYAEKRFADFDIEPSPDTVPLLRRQGLLLKIIDNRLYVLSEIENKQPKRVLDQPLRLTFYLHIKNDYFTNFTNLNLNSFRGSCYYFSNLSNNHDAPTQTQYLSLPIAAYQKNITYQLGDIVADSKGKLYEAIVQQPSQAPQADSTNWQLCEAQNQGATYQDRPLLLSVNDMQRQENMLVKDWANPLKPEFRPPITQERHRRGVYLLQTPNGQQKALIEDRAAYIKPSAVVEIFHHPTLSKPYQLIDEQGKMQSPVYTINFKNRATLWRYILHGRGADWVQDKSKQHAFEKLNDREFVSQKPIPLTQEPIRSLMLGLGAAGTFSPLPNPGIYQVVPQEGQLYSNVHINL